MSGIFKLNWRDLFNGLVVAVGSAVLTLLVQVLTQGGFASVSWPAVGQVAAMAAGGYLLKNLGTPDNGATLGIKAMAVPPPAPKE